MRVQVTARLQPGFVSTTARLSPALGNVAAMNAMPEAFVRLRRPAKTTTAPALQLAVADLTRRVKRARLPARTERGTTETLVAAGRLAADRMHGDCATAFARPPSAKPNAAVETQLPAGGQAGGVVM